MNRLVWLIALTSSVIGAEDDGIIITKNERGEQILGRILERFLTLEPDGKSKP